MNDTRAQNAKKKLQRRLEMKKSEVAKNNVEQSSDKPTATTNNNNGKEVKFCLNMIVRNEKDNIVRCCDSVSHIIDAIAIVDTGSVDNTIDIIRDYCRDKNIPGEVISETWVNFGHNRTGAIRHAEAFTSKT